MLNDRHIRLLEERGLDAELLTSYGVASDSSAGPDAIAIPYYDGENIVNTKRRTIAGEKRFWQDAGARPIFWNINAINDPTLVELPLIITEGELDAFAALQAGYARCVSAPNGAPKSEMGERASDRYAFLDNAPKALADCREIIIATDGDAPGLALLNDLALRLGRARCKWVRYPRECKDLGDALRLYGIRGVIETINRAQWMQVDGLYRMSELPPLPPSVPHASGFPGLDEHFRLRLGDFTVVTGIPSMGKTTVVNDIACRMAERHQWRTAFASFEQVPQRDHRRWLRTRYCGKREMDQDAREQTAADDWIDKNFLFVVPDEDDSPTLDWMLERFATAVVRHGVRIVIVDPWNEMEHDKPPEMSLTEYVGHALRRIKRFARKFQVHFFVVAHPMKMRRLEDGKVPMPTLYDVSDSAHWYNRSDCGIIVHRDADKTIVRIEKSRYHDEIGKPGDVNVRYVPAKATFELETQEF